MHIQLAYGEQGLPLTLPDDADVTVLAPRFVPGVADPSAALAAALAAPIGSPPLRELVAAGDSVGIVFSDGTRATPNHLIIPAVLDALRHVPDAQITLFNATGTHRFNTDTELRAMLGDVIVDRFRIVQNDAAAPGDHACVGTTRGGNAVWLHRDFLACRAKILTGFIEPHFFAGFSGGGKAVLPGLARLDTIQWNHRTAHVDDPRAVWGVTAGNPLWEDVTEGAGFADPTFLLNVTLNCEKAITRVFAGDFTAAHRAGCAFVRDTAMAAVDRPFDIVITTNAGFPLDRNLYQAVKGMSAAAQIVADGGAILIAAECRDGLPAGSDYARLLAEATDYAEILATVRTPGFLRPEMWQAHIQALIAAKADLHLYCDTLNDLQIRAAHLTPCRDLATTIAMLRERYGQTARIAILPEGPQTLPYLT